MAAYHYYIMRIVCTSPWSQFTLLMFLGGLLFAAHGAEPPAAWPLWDGHESTAKYAQRVNLPPAKTLDLGNGVKLETVLIPAGKFIMGTPEPEPVDEDGFRKKIVTGQAFLAASGGVLFVMLSVVVIRAIRLRRRPQYSLARFIVMMLVLSVGVLGGEHWWYSSQALENARVEYQAALARYKECNGDEKTAHKVIITTPFYFGKFSVTQEQYQQVIGVNPSRFKGKDNPVEMVSWDDSQEFCKKLGQATNQTVRLPTEAEWEYSCRAGTSTNYYSGDSEGDLKRVAWYGANHGISNSTTHPVGQKDPNLFGLYDMHGNVWQWCQDWFNAYSANEVADPQGYAQSPGRVLRGGSWLDDPSLCRSAFRFWHDSGSRFYHFGFRVVVVPAARTP